MNAKLIEISTGEVLSEFSEVLQVSEKAITCKAGRGRSVLMCDETKRFVSSEEYAATLVAEGQAECQMAESETVGGAE